MQPRGHLVVNFVVVAASGAGQNSEKRFDNFDD